MLSVRKVPLNAERVSWAAAQQGIDSDAELSRRSGIERRFLGRLLTGEKLALPKHLLALAETLGVDPETLVADDEAVAS